jgi:hypothetical protein
MPNATDIDKHAAGWCAYLALEEPIRDAGCMASIANGLVTDFLCGDDVKQDGDYVVIRLREHEHLQLIFAIGKVREMAIDLDRAYQAGSARP